MADPIDRWVAAHAGEASAAGDDPETPIDPADTLRWMHALHSDDLTIRARAEAELGRQGFETFQWNSPGN